MKQRQKTANCVIRLGLAGLFLGALCLPLAAQSSAIAPAPGIPLRIIVVNTSAEAAQIAARLKKGEDFAVLARENSTDPSAESGGYMGIVSPATLRSELRDALTRVKTGEVSAVAHIPAGYALVEVLPTEAVAAMEGASQARVSMLSAIGSIKYTPNVSGIGEAETALFRSAKPTGWDQDLRQICETRKQTLADATKRMEDTLAPANSAARPNQSAVDLTQEYYALGELYAYPGKMDQAIEQYQKAYEVALARAPTIVPQLEQELGVAYLHRSEMANDIYRAPGDRCLIPNHPGTAFSKTEDSRKAIQYFLKYLDKVPEDLAARWLLNYAFMTLGGYPAAVPPKYLVPVSAFESKEGAPHFTDVAPVAGLNLFSTAGGIIVDDFENNGLLDVVTSSMNMCEHMHYFHNNGDGTFSDRSEPAGLMDQLGGLNITQADYNNDGCTDILVMRGGWEIPMRKSLLRNNCHGSFTDVTREAGLAESSSATQTAVWTDINNDGLLDLLVGSENGAAQLFLNKGDGTFENISHSAGIDRVAFTKAVIAADYDNDGYPDLYLSNYAGNNFLYHNNHDNTFTDVAPQAGVLGPWISFASWFFDYDNDGWPDLFVTSYFISIDESVRTYLGMPHNAIGMKLYHNLGNGTFKDVSAETGLDKVFMPMGANFGDIDNDGFLDIYLGNGNPNYASLLPHVLLRNHDGKYFSDVTAASGTGELHKGHGVAFADLSRGGYEDILTVTGGAVPGDSHAMRVFENPGNGNDWINLKLVGVKSNREAVGTRIKVTVENEGQGTRSIYRTVGSGGSFGASPMEQHIGLGKSARIVNIEISWPASNTKQNFAGVGKNQFLEIKEFAAEYAKLDRRAVRLGGANRLSSSLKPTQGRAQ
jgi:hypothetical protein